MHKDFADWYRAAVPEPQSDTLEARWKAIETFLAEASIDKALEVARIFIGISTKDAEFKETFANMFRAVDATFPSSRNNVELRVLAGSTCAAAIESQDVSTDISEILALAVTTGGCRRKRQGLILPRILTICEEYLYSRSARRFEENEDQVDLDEASKAVEQVCTTGHNLSHIAKPLGHLVDSVRKKFATTYDRQRLLQEETDVLWWLYAGRSRDLQTSFARIEVGALPIVAGKELADLTTYLPGPFAYPELLQRVLGFRERQWKGSISEAVDALPRKWRENLAADRSNMGAVDLCPIYAAIIRSTEVKNGKSWVKPAESELHMSLKNDIEPLDVAIQAFLEGILCRYLKSNDDGAG